MAEVIYLSNWTIETGKLRKVVKGVIVPEGFDIKDVLYTNRMKAQLYNCKQREFPASHEKIKVLKVELDRPIQGL